MKFSYPGYNELFCGFGDDRIRSDSMTNNPNLSVFEFLDPAKLAYRVTRGHLLHLGRLSLHLSQQPERVEGAGRLGADRRIATDAGEQAANGRMARLPRTGPTIRSTW